MVSYEMRETIKFNSHTCLRDYFPNINKHFTYNINYNFFSVNDHIVVNNLNYQFFLTNIHVFLMYEYNILTNNLIVSSFMQIIKNGVIIINFIVCL